jgi:hypothetical protein
MDLLYCARAVNDSLLRALPHPCKALIEPTRTESMLLLAVVSDKAPVLARRRCLRTKDSGGGIEIGMFPSWLGGDGFVFKPRTQKINFKTVDRRIYKNKRHTRQFLGRFTNPLEGTALVTDVKNLRETMRLGHP